VTVTDVDMPFTSMVRFMVKWAIAAIPAMVILMILVAIFWGVLLGVIGSIGSSSSPKAATETPPPPSTKGGYPTPQSGSNAQSATAPSDPAAVVYLSKMLVRNIRVSKGYLDETGVFGEVKNSGDRSLKEVEITIYCLDSNGQPVFEKKYHPVLVSALSFASNEPLKPGYSRQFGVKLDDAPSDWSKKVDVKVTAVEFQ
jgi:hypothetical protein